MDVREDIDGRVCDVFDAVMVRLAGSGSVVDVEAVDEMCRAVAGHGFFGALPVDEQAAAVCSWRLRLMDAERLAAEPPRGSAHTAFDAWADGAADPAWSSDERTAVLTVTPRPPSDSKHGIHGSRKTKRMPPTAATASPVVVRRQPSRRHFLAASGEYVTPRQVAAVLADVTALPPLRFGRFG